MTRTLLAATLLTLTTGGAHADPKGPPAGGYKPTNDVEEIAVKHTSTALEKESERMKERCGFTIPVDIVYTVPMKEWIGAEEWGLHKGCTDDAKTGGCVNLSWCAGEVVTQFWFTFCNNGQVPGTRSDYKDWNKKVKRLVCRGEGPVAGTSRADSKYSKMKASLAKDGTLTVTLHPSDSNVSTDFYEWLEPRISTK